MNYDQHTPHTAEVPFYIKQIRAEARGLPPPEPERPVLKTGGFYDDDLRHVFTVCTGNRWLELGARQPPAKMLFGELWHQNELCILFADTNAGKSILAVQIADSLARPHKTIGPFARHNKPSRVLYVDFELSTTQFRNRYSTNNTEHCFPDNFTRAEFNSGADIQGDTPAQQDAFIMAAIEYKMTLVKANVLIIDNITCLRSGTENAAVALRLMKSLKALKVAYNLSILVLAHTPKRRNPRRPLGADDLHGSKLLINFADSAFTLGASNASPGLCYLKQIKQRNTEQRYGYQNVCLCRIARSGAFLKFNFLGNSAEGPHLLPAGVMPREVRAENVAKLSAQGLSQRKIGKSLGIAGSTVNKFLKELGKSGKSGKSVKSEKSGKPELQGTDQGPEKCTAPPQPKKSVKRAMRIKPAGAIKSPARLKSDALHSVSAITSKGEGSSP